MTQDLTPPTPPPTCPLGGSSQTPFPHPGTVTLQNGDPSLHEQMASSAFSDRCGRGCLPRLLQRMLTTGGQEPDNSHGLSGLTDLDLGIPIHSLASKTLGTTFCSPPLHRHAMPLTLIGTDGLGERTNDRN